LIQGCWDKWCDGDSYEKLSEKWWIGSLRTVQRWLRPLIRGHTDAMSELRRLWHLEEPTEKRARPDRFQLLDAIRQTIQKSPKIRHGTEYFHVQVAGVPTG
jgi:hypothetical protein